MDRELIAYLGEQFAKQNEQVAQQFAKQNERFDRQDERFARIEERLTRQEERLVGIDEGVRHTQVTVEGLWGDLRQVAEGVIGMDEKLESFRTAIALDIDDVRKLIRSIYAVLDQRVRSVEVRQGRDPVDIIRERFGKPPEKPPE